VTSATPAGAAAPGAARGVLSPTVPLLLLSGAGLPAWAWDRMRDALPGKRPTFVAPKPGNGDRSLDAYADAALDAVPWPSFVVVGHSIGGVVGTRIVERAPGRVVGFVGISASIPVRGRSFFGALPAPQRWIVSGITRVAGTRPPEGMLRKGLCHGLEPADADRVVRDFAPESQALYRDRTGARTFPAVRGYVRTAEDPDFPLDLQDRFAATLGTERTATLATGHLPMLQDPVGTAGAIERLLS
jgi:pimeloyl-ACP methyl ester carboxylesterase